MYARLAVERRDGQARAIVWQLSGDRGFSQQRERVASQVAAAVDEMAVATGAAPVVIGKSLGSLAAAVAADRGLAAVWFTPLLTDEPTAAALRRASARACWPAGPLTSSGTAGPSHHRRRRLSRSRGVALAAGAQPKPSRTGYRQPLRSAIRVLLWRPAT